MSLSRVLKIVLGVTKTVIESVRFEQDRLVVSVRPQKRQTLRCPYCNKKGAFYDAGRGTRRWRTLDLGSIMTFFESSAPRILCTKHGVVVASVPWARHGSWFTHAFEQQVSWLCVPASRSAVAELMRIDWKSVGSICKRVYDDLDKASGNRFDNLVRIGVDETSYKKGHKYMTVILNHDTGRVIWCAKGYGKEVLEGFFKSLSQDQCSSIEVVTADGARWIKSCVEAYCTNAVRVMDPFHVVSWATDALDGIRKEAWRDARAKDKMLAQPVRGRGRPRTGEIVRRKNECALIVKEARYPLLKNPEDLTERQLFKLEQIAREDKRLYRAYQVKEHLRSVFRLSDPIEARAELDAWLSKTCRSRILALVEISRKIRRHRDAIVAAIEHGISNARVEAINNKIKLTVRMGYGFRNIDNLIALVMLRCSNLPLRLPGRA